MKKISLISILVLVCAFATAQQYQEGVIVEKLLQTSTTVTGQKFEYPMNSSPEVSMYKITLPAGKETGWHKHDVPVFAYVVKGTITVEIEGGKKFTYTPNSTIAEVINTMHNGSNLGKEDVVLIATYIGEKAAPNSVKRINATPTPKPKPVDTPHGLYW